jgi:hypothetical protein
MECVWQEIQSPSVLACGLHPTIYKCIQVSSAPEDGDSMFLRNVGINLKNLHGAKTQDFDNNIIIIVVRTSNLIRDK